MRVPTTPRTHTATSTAAHSSNGRLARGGWCLRSAYASTIPAIAVAPIAPLPKLIANSVAHAAQPIASNSVLPDCNARRAKIASAPNAIAPAPINVENGLDKPNQPVASGCKRRRS